MYNLHCKLVFLCFVVSVQDIKVDEEKVRAIQDFPSPMNDAFSRKYVLLSALDS